VSVEVFVTAPNLAEMFTLVFADCVLVVTVNVALVFPAATVTVAGTVPTPVLLLERVITAPPEGAAPLSVTVPCELAPPLTLVGFNVSDDRLTALPGVMVSVACCELLPMLAVIVPVVLVVTAVVLTVKVALVAPGATATLDGTLAELLLLASVTSVPAAGAAALRVTVPVELPPPVTLVGLSASEETVIGGAPGLMVSAACCELPPTVAVTVALAIVVTAGVVMANETVVWPAETPTLDGNPAALLLLESVTTVPPEGATLLIVTVP
jgi:hypothetical protein